MDRTIAVEAVEDICLDVFEDQEEVAELVTGPSAYEYLTARGGLLRKVAGVTIAKVAATTKMQLSQETRKDLEQELHIFWLTLNVDAQYAESQVCQRIVLSGLRQCLKVLRSMTACVYLPGNLFRPGKGGAFMDSIGAALNPADVYDSPEALDLAVEPDEHMPVTVSQDLVLKQLRGCDITLKQRKLVAAIVVDGLSVDTAAEKLQLTKPYVQRIFNDALTKIEAHCAV